MINYKRMLPNTIYKTIHHSQPGAKFIAYGQMACKDKTKYTMWQEGPLITVRDLAGEVIRRYPPNSVIGNLYQPVEIHTMTWIEATVHFSNGKFWFIDVNTPTEYSVPPDGECTLVGDGIFLVIRDGDLRIYSMNLIGHIHYMGTFQPNDSTNPADILQRFKFANGRACGQYTEPDGTPYVYCENIRNNVSRRYAGRMIHLDDIHLYRIHDDKLHVLDLHFTETIRIYDIPMRYLHDIKYIKAVAVAQLYIVCGEYHMLVNPCGLIFRKKISGEVVHVELGPNRDYIRVYFADASIREIRNRAKHIQQDYEDFQPDEKRQCTEICWLLSQYIAVDLAIDVLDQLIC